MKVQFRNSLIAVEQVNKADRSNRSFLHQVEDSNSIGVIKFLGDKADPDLKIGQKVAFGNKREPIVIDGTKLLVMESENVVAIIAE